ncbi:MAG: hypothetical protein FOGNACKC_05532 [Anaerolineae bacterium]|nr:hypothetical protein [Anaerolineae bacterium]
MADRVALHGLVYEIADTEVRIVAVNRADATVILSRFQAQSVAGYLQGCGFSVSTQQIIEAVDAWNGASNE